MKKMKLERINMLLKYEREVETIAQCNKQIKWLVDRIHPK